MTRTFRGKTFKWSEEKDETLKAGRGISFAVIEHAIAERLLDIRRNRSRKHPGQLVFIVAIDDYPWVVPFEESHDSIFLITAYPDRRFKDEYQGQALKRGKADLR